MSKAAAKKTTTRRESGDKPQTSGIFIALQFLDTGWRVALPILVISYIGIQLDKSHGTTPLYSVGGLLFSIVVSAFLVYRQIKDNFPEFPGGKE